MRCLLPLLGLPLLALVACSDPKPPTVCRELPQVTVNVGEVENVEPCFEDPEGGAIKLTSVSYQPEVATANVVGSRVRITGKGRGQATVEITATDPDNMTAKTEVDVLVPNRAPTGSLGDLTLYPGFETSVNLAGSFSDPDGDTLTFSASSSAPGIVSVTVSDTILTLAALAQEGSAQVSVTASDGEEETTVMFQVAVRAPVVVLSDDFNSDETLDDWDDQDVKSTEIKDGYLIVHLDTLVLGVATQELGGNATDVFVDVVLRTTDEDAMAGVYVETGHTRFPFYFFWVGLSQLGNLPEANWTFSWWDNDRPAGQQHLVDTDWSMGISSAIDDFTDVHVVLSVTEQGLRVTANGQALINRSAAPLIPRTASTVGLGLYREFWESDDENSASTNSITVFAGEFDDNSPHAYEFPDIAKVPKLQILKK